VTGIRLLQIDLPEEWVGGRQLEHPSEVNSSTIATDDGEALIEPSGEAACDSRGAARRASEIAKTRRICIGVPPANGQYLTYEPRNSYTFRLEDIL
jgi:hypothetical protein